ncbi:hypothetical protein TorRG33x02_057940 [Trema orientale]|uniref:Uncharacterized protein n=1 Tax=Trema orientale TaxID=63057 RepID=A0A2P5FL86_TREOI|nr:hypothetical protein TorRG33x02_057940 [Trema orientale]
MMVVVAVVEASPMVLRLGLYPVQRSQLQVLFSVLCFEEIYGKSFEQLQKSDTKNELTPESRLLCHCELRDLSHFQVLQVLSSHQGSGSGYLD